MEHPELTIYDHDTVYIEGGTGDNYVLAHIESSSHKNELKWAQLFKAAPLMYEALQAVKLWGLAPGDGSFEQHHDMMEVFAQLQAALDAAGGE